MEQLAEEFSELSQERIDKIDPFIDTTPFRAKPLQRKRKTGVRYDGEGKGGEISLFDK
ncbi:hypothetical protein [Lactococcus garvieae]|uniref:hypothetical protein n=1 Tax=Lactococcus garvieae TaxID=1363 RepID=UPI00254F3ABF|nr:hypothetical protein [Lactococcus garvieae]